MQHSILPTVPVVFQSGGNITLNIQPDPRHEWLLTTEQVAEGFGVSTEAIRSAKSRHSDEVVQDKHFLDVAICNARPGNGAQSITLWTKRGVVRLGLFLRSERAKRFRDFCEDLVLNATAATQVQTSQPPPQPVRLPTALELRLKHPVFEAMKDPAAAKDYLQALQVWHVFLLDGEARRYIGLLAKQRRCSQEAVERLIKREFAVPDDVDFGMWFTLPHYEPVMRWLGDKLPPHQR
jgi:hypothetical protein